MKTLLLDWEYITSKRRGLQVNVLDCCSYMIPSCSGPYITLWIMSWAGSLMIWSWSGLFMNSYNYFPDHPVNVLDCFSYDTILSWTIYVSVNNVPDHSWNVLWMSWAGSAMIQSWSGLFRHSHNHFPDHPVNYPGLFFLWHHFVLDHIWPCKQCPGPFLKCTVNVLGRLYHDVILVQGIYELP